MKHLIHLVFVAVVAIFVGGGTLRDMSVSCSGDKHGESDKKHSDGH